MKAFQDYYPDNVAQCYGCGSNNHHGHQIKTHWDGEETVTLFTPEPYQTSVPGFAYGGLVASLIDCHSTGTAAAAMSIVASTVSANGVITARGEVVAVQMPESFGRAI